MELGFEPTESEPSECESLPITTRPGLPLPTQYLETKFFVA